MDTPGRPGGGQDPQLVLAQLLSGAGDSGRGSGPRREAPGGNTDDVAGSLAAALQLSADDLNALFEFTEDGPQLVVHSSRVPKTNVQAATEFAILVTRAREILGLETEAGDIRKALDRYGKYDATNFSKQIAKVDPSRLNYSKTSKKLTLRHPGREFACDLAKRYVGAET